MTPCAVQSNSPVGLAIPCRALTLIGLITIIVLTFTIAASAGAAAQQSGEQLQSRYRLCTDKADADFLEEFRGSCDVLCIQQQHGTEGACLAQHMQWNKANCTLSAAETYRQEQHLEKAKDRCLKEFKAGITAPP